MTTAVQKNPTSYQIEKEPSLSRIDLLSQKVTEAQKKAKQAFTEQEEVLKDDFTKVPEFKFLTQITQEFVRYNQLRARRYFEKAREKLSSVDPLYTLFEKQVRRRAFIQTETIAIEELMEKKGRQILWITCLALNDLQISARSYHRTCV